MPFEIDVLIAFAEADNETSRKQDVGWVTNFKKFLELMLYQVLGEKPNVLLKGEFDSLTAPTMDNAAVLVTVLSRDFAQSGRCLDLVESFQNKAGQSKLPRVFKVLKTPLTNPEQPPRLREMQGYDMFQLDPETGQPKEYSDFFSQEAEKQYWMKMVDLAYDIHESLLYFKQGEQKSEVKNIFRKKIIFLAETGHDLSVQRNIIKRELQRYGYVVLPTQSLPETYTELEKAVQKDLSDANLSIHLIGNAYGEIPEGADRSVIDIQNKLAAEESLKKKSRKEEFSRLIWIAPNLKFASDRQKAFIESIRRDIEAQEGAEILQNPLEDFKNIVREELLDTPDIFNDDVSGKAVYLVYDKIDHEEIAQYKHIIEEAGIKVLLPQFDADLLELRKKHIENLRKFDAAIIFKGKVNDQWVRMKVLDLLKAPGFGRKKPIKGRAILSPHANGIDQFAGQNITLIAGEANKSVSALKSFLEDVNA